MVFAKGHSFFFCLSTFSKDLSPETTGKFQFTFICFLLAKRGGGGKKVFMFDPCHMTKMSAMPLYAE